MIIRTARATDCDKILDLLRQVMLVHFEGRPDIFKGIGTKYDYPALLKIMADPLRPIFVAEIEGAVVGYAFCVIKETKGSPLLCDMKTLHVDDLCIDKNCRGKGIGKALMAHCRRYAEKQGCYNLTLNVWSCNVEARKFYDKLGFKEQKTNMEVIL